MRAGEAKHKKPLKLTTVIGKMKFEKLGSLYKYLGARTSSTCSNKKEVEAWLIKSKEELPGHQTNLKGQIIIIDKN